MKLFYYNIYIQKKALIQNRVYSYIYNLFIEL